MHYEFLLVAVEKWLKSVYICRNYCKIKTGFALYWNTM